MPKLRISLCPAVTREQSSAPARACRAGLLSVLMAVSATASAQTADSFPARPVRILAPFAAGGTGDTVARLLAPKLTEAWGQQIVIENRPGAGGVIGMEAARYMPADGYSYVVISNSTAASEAIYPRLNYDLRRDFMAINIVASSPMLIAVNAKFEADNMVQLAAALQREPGKRSYGSCGVGSAYHLAVELLKFEAKLAVQHIPYKGCAPAIVEAISGQIDIVIGPPSAIVPHVRAGRLKAIAVTFNHRAASAPSVPTVAESGGPRLAGFSVDNWYGFMAPIGSPRDIAGKFEREVNRALALPAMREQLAQAGIDIRLGNAAAFMEAYLADLKQFKQVVEAAGIKPE